MNLEATPSAAEPDEITGLIESLHAIEKRLEQLTAGEVDTVIDRHGRMILLSRAQEQLRYIEAEKQASILNALPAHIALLDADGFIVSVNQAWKRFADKNAMHGPGHAVGLNYVDVCDNARGDHSAEAHQVADAIRAVLLGTAKSFSIEYPCDSPSEQRWFQMMVTPLAENRTRGAVVMHLDISARKRGEEDLLRFRLAMDTSGDAITLIQRSTMRFIDVNTTACAMFGYTREELLQIGPASLVSVTTEQLAQLYDGVIAADGDDVPVESVVRRKDGSTLEVEIRRHAQKSGDDWIIVGVARDITQRKRMEDAMRSSATEFRALAEAMPQMVWITRPDGWNTYFSQQWMDYTGLTLEESLGHGWSVPFHPEDRELAQSAWQHATQTVTIYSVECRLRRADGDYRWWLIRGVPQLSVAGGVLKWFGTCTDIHTLKSAQLDLSASNRALQESERRFSELLAKVELASVMLDCEARVTFCNEYLLRLTGYELHEVIGRDWFNLFIPSSDTGLKEVFAQLLADVPASWHRENEILTRSGEARLMRWNNSVLRSAGGEVIGSASIGEDITDQKKADEVLAKRAVELERFHRLSVGRELQMIDLKKQINELATQAGRPPPHDLSFIAAQAAKAHGHGPAP